MAKDVRVELLELAVARYDDARLADYLGVAVEKIRYWLLAGEPVPDSAMHRLVDFMHPDRTRH